MCDPCFKDGKKIVQQGIFAGNLQQEDTKIKSIFWDYENNKSPETAASKEMETTRQDGPNCGCYAAAFAIYSLLSNDKQMIDVGERNKTVVEELIKGIAKEIEAIGTKNNVSAVGEFFDADCLAAAINTFCVDNKIGLLAKSVTFEDEKKFEKIIKMAQERNVKVLVPYFAGSQSSPFMSTTPVLENEMNHAHWAVAEMKITENGKVKLYEGHQKNPQCSMETLYDSNRYLGKWFSWNAFIQSRYVNAFTHIKHYEIEKEEDKEKKENLLTEAERELESVKHYETKVRNAIAHRIKLEDSSTDDMKHPSNDIKHPIDDKDRELVALANHLILVGLEDPNAENPEAEKPVAS